MLGWVGERAAGRRATRAISHDFGRHPGPVGSLTRKTSSDEPDRFATGNRPRAAGPRLPISRIAVIGAKKAVSRNWITAVSLSLCLFGMMTHSASAAPPGLLRIFGPTPAAKVAAQDPRRLSEVDGPWMILAASFAGPEGKAKADQLADELAQEFGLATFIHEANFDFTGQLNQPDADGRVMRYVNENKYAAFAVLVGEYDSIDHPQLDKDLKRIKAANPKVFEGEPENVASEPDAAGSTPLDAVRSLKRGLLNRVGRSSAGPMSNAFATTNPMLPTEYFMAPEVDSFVMELNSEVEHSLLNNPAKFTVVVGTFSGLSMIANGTLEKTFQPSSERMDTCALNADKMVRELRKKGVEAYQFHDRTRSMVTIGGFERLGEVAPGGKFEYAPEIRRVMENYRAGNNVQMTQFGPVIHAEHVASIPFDVNPTPIAVPKKSKRSLYSGRMGMR